MDAKGHGVKRKLRSGAYLLVLFVATLAAQTQEPIGIPLKPDPPFAIDGDLGDWSAVPNAISISAPEQVVWGTGTWTSSADLSGTVHLAWRNEYLFLAAEVRDDSLRQSQRGASLWKGDHIELYVDVQPDRDPTRDSFDEGQFQVALSPGNFQQTGDALADTTPEVFVYQPKETPAEGALAASAQTATGYTLEAAIPWAVLGITQASKGMPLRFEIGISDTDSQEPVQEALMTTSTDKWGHTRSRLRAAALAGTDGTAQIVPRQVPVFGDLELARKEKAGPPTGPLERIEPRATPVAFHAVENSDAVITATVGSESFTVQSRFSTPKPEWVQGANTFFEHTRAIEVNNEAVIVRDTFTNLTNDKLPLMQRNEVALGDRLNVLWLSGLQQAGGSGSTNGPSNPTTYAATESASIGLLPLSDVMRVHVINYGVNGSVGMGDNNLVLAPGAAYTAEWAIIPTDTPDYWQFINAARRLAGANFLIDGAFAFFRAGPLTDMWTDEQTLDFLRFKDVKYTCASIDFPLYENHYPHGTAFQRIDHDNYRAAFERRRRLAPGVKNLVYFHCFIDVLGEGPELFADSRVLRPDGAQADYGLPHDRIYFPAESNSFGPAIARNIDVILDDIGADGVYWDEHEYSRWNYHYGEPWDGYSGDIDPQTMTLARLKSSVTLLSEPWRIAQAKRILARGTLIGNGPPFTRAMAALKFPCFVETGSITHCTQAHLYSPIALGDHLTEQSELDAYSTMLAALDYACVYHWYNDVTVIPTHHHLVRYMYPMTPMELHEGYIIGQERIITKKSGLFGWGDASAHEVHVFDETGREAEGFDAPAITQDGKTYTELRIGEGWSAAIIRKRESA